MKLKQLHINRFGHFNECDLGFAGDGLQVICGPNEAGKTTLLEFLRGLLFDFPARTPYDFGGQGEMAGVATLELRDGRAVELRRRKGNKDKVAIKLNGQPTDLDDSGWLRLLDHADRGLFESVFAFGLDRLSQGEVCLKHESLQSALFGGSLGGTTSPDKVVTELGRQADELFKKGGSKPAINALLSELKRLTKEIKDRSLRPAKYHEAEAAVTAAAERARAFHERVDQLRREHSKVEKQVRAWPKWWDLQQRITERAKVSIPDNVPADARQQYLAVAKELKSLVSDQAKRTEEIKQAEKSLDLLKLNPVALMHRAEIKSCFELRQSFIEAKDQLPERQRQREAVRLQIDRELAELRPGWSHEDLRAFSVDMATRVEIDRLSKDGRERATTCTTLKTKRDGDAATIEQTRRELAEIGPPRDVTALAIVLADEADFVATRKQLENSAGELAKLDRKLATQSRKLTPPLSAATPAVHELSVPRAETIADFETRFAEIREPLRTTLGLIEDDEEEERQIEKALATAMSSHIVPSLEERDDARARRDVGWSLIRQQYISSQPVDTAIAAWLEVDADTVLPDGYEKAVRTADDIADRIYDNAKEVADREGLRRQLAALATRLTQKRQRRAELERQQAELQVKWAGIWQTCGFEPLAPDAMLGWLSDHEAVCASVSHRDELIDLQAQLRKRITSFEDRLRSASDRADGDVSDLVTAVRQAVDDAKAQQRRTVELQKEVRRLEQQVAKYDGDLQSLTTRETAASANWLAVLRRLNLPVDWDIELAREAIDKLKTTRVRLDGLPNEEARITAMQARIKEFDARVHSVCEILDPDHVNDPAEVVIKKLEGLAESAAEAHRKHEELSHKLAATRIELESLNQRYKQHDAERARLFTLTNTNAEAEYLEVVSQAEKAVRLDGEIEQLTRDVDLIRAGESRDEFEQSLATGDLIVLQGQERDLKEELKKADSARTTADGEEALSREALNQLDGSGEVAILTEELSRKRSQLAAEVDRYMPLIYARHLLNAAVSRFEKENQPEMIALVSRLLSQMTGGKYVEFDRSGGGKQDILVRRFDGVEKTSEQLSTGTREQLYLAIRLAYVLQYCQQNEPLPIIVDDVLVNFDDQRARQTLIALADISQSVQVLFFTCHSHLLEIAREVVPGLIPINLPDTP